MEISRIDPPCWFANMNALSLQLVVYGSDLSGTDIKVMYPTFLKTSIVHSSYNYLILNLDTTTVSANSSCSFLFCKNGEEIVREYKFLPRREKQIKQLSIKDSIYLLMPDRFAKETDNKRANHKNPNSWHGGTINGMTSHLDEIVDMGFTAIWHTPVFENNQHTNRKTKYYNYHGYAITDFYAVDPHFGSIDDYCRFVDSAHKKGVKVIMDMLFNHCGIDHPFVKRLPMDDWLNNLGEGQSRLTNYSPLTVYDRYASEYDRQHFVKGWFTQEMPDLNLSNAHLLQYMTQMTIWWIETTDIDAFRIDTYPYVGVDYMEQWQRKLYADYPCFPLLAEAWVGETEYVAKVQKANLDSIEESRLIFMDFPFQRRLVEAFEKGDARVIYNHFALDFAYSEPHNLLAFIDNHDICRWLSKQPSIDKLKQAIGLLLTVPRIPQVYYGTEILLKGDGKGNSDGNMRQDYPWDTALNPIQRDFKSFLCKILKWRTECKCISEGTMIHFVPLDDNVYVYFRIIRKATPEVHPMVMIMINFSDIEAVVEMSRFKEILSDCKSVYDVVADEKTDIDITASVPIKANGLMILELYK